MPCHIDDTVEGVVVAFLSLILVYIAQQLGILHKGATLARSVSGQISGGIPRGSPNLIMDPNRET
jgi:hypothetical protein